jgi:hypothetical protein
MVARQEVSSLTASIAPERPEPTNDDEVGPRY